ncbi:MAG: hypothetical protein HYR62_01120 [Actinobacteria bacterium]|nr:hypothetical protein [Actinomycetota bacterium]MBI3686661.1 hypothetical protein [Actinomycetota bacterium]
MSGVGTRTVLPVVVATGAATSAGVGGLREASSRWPNLPGAVERREALAA